MSKAKPNFLKYLFEIIKAFIIAMIISLGLVLIAAFAIKTFSVKTGAIPVINQAIKCLAILVSALICLKEKGGGFLRGFILGVVYSILSYVIFSLFNGTFSFGVSLLNDVVLGGIVGLISGIIAVNLRK